MWYISTFKVYYRIYSRSGDSKLGVGGDNLTGALHDERYDLSDNRLTRVSKPGPQLQLSPPLPSLLAPIKPANPG